MTDLGIRYVDFLEKLSSEIQSNFDEAEMIEDAKASRILGGMKQVAGAGDKRIKMLNAILPYLKSWSSKNQYEFLLYLRGSIAATPFIEKQFPAFGAERMRKIYQGLPLNAKIGTIRLYLTETFLARKEVTSKDGKKLMKYLIDQGDDEEVKDYAGLMLESLLLGLEQAGNKDFQFDVLSALIAMAPNKSLDKNDPDRNKSVGETLKLILEQFPGIGPKIGQFLVATNLLEDGINKVLVDTQDKTLPPKWYEMYTDLESIIGGGHELGFDIIKFLGGGGVKYSFSAREKKTGEVLAMQVFRNDFQNNADVQIEVLDYAIKDLIKKDGPRWAFLQVVVNSAIRRVQREKRVAREAMKTSLARKGLYSGFNDDKIKVAVPIQELINNRLLVSRYAKGGSFMRMSKEDQQIVGQKILRMEAEILYPEEFKQSSRQTKGSSLV